MIFLSFYATDESLSAFRINLSSINNLLEKFDILAISLEFLVWQSTN